jgi:hypothetical protein
MDSIRTRHVAQKNVLPRRCWRAGYDGGQVFEFLTNENNFLLVKGFRDWRDNSAPLNKLEDKF